MKLIHTATLKPAEIGDEVTTRKGDTGIIKYFIPPHKPASSGHVSVAYTDRHPLPGYHYVRVWGVERVGREDRA